LSAFFLGSRGNSTDEEIKIKKRELFILLQNEQFFNFSSYKCNEHLLHYIIDKFGDTELSEHCTKQIKCVVKVLVSKLFKKWRACNYMTYDRFNTKHMRWFDDDLKLPEVQLSQISLSALKRPEKSSRGGPKKSLEESSQRSKQKQLNSILSEHSSEQVCLAAESSLVKSGRRTAAQVLKLAIDTTPTRLKKMKLVHNISSSITIRPYSPEEALGLIVDLGLTKEDYITMRLGAKENGADIYPSYHVIQEAKSKCYPINIKISENEAVVPLK